jgi:hypothetical protein
LGQIRLLPQCPIEDRFSSNSRHIILASKMKYTADEPSA